MLQGRSNIPEKERIIRNEPCIILKAINTQEKPIKDPFKPQKFEKVGEDGGAGGQSPQQTSST